jgi:hypothetical protein
MPLGEPEGDRFVAFSIARLIATFSSLKSSDGPVGPLRTRYAPIGSSPERSDTIARILRRSKFRWTALPTFRFTA